MKWPVSRGWTIAVGGLVAVLVIGELLAWPFLAQPMQDFLTRKLEREVRFAPQTAQDKALSPAQAEVKQANAFGVRFLGGLHLQVGQLNIASAAWSQAPYLLQATAVQVDLRYIDLWRFYRGEPSLRIERLRAEQLDAQLERLADGRASWQFGPPPTTPVVVPAPLPRFGRVEVANGRLALRDQQIGADVAATLSLVQGQTPQLQVLATGQYRQMPLRIDLLASGELPLLVGDDVGSVLVVPPASAGSAGSAVTPIAAASAKTSWHNCARSKP